MVMLVNDERSYTDLKPTVLTAWERPHTFRSLRWTVTLPLLAIIVIGAMLATYVATDGLSRGLRNSRLQQMLSSAHALSDQAITLGNDQARQADRVAFTQ